MELRGLWEDIRVENVVGYSRVEGNCSKVVGLKFLEVVRVGENCGGCEMLWKLWESGD